MEAMVESTVCRRIDECRVRSHSQKVREKQLGTKEMNHHEWSHKEEGEAELLLCRHCSRSTTITSACDSTNIAQVNSKIC